MAAEDKPIVALVHGAFAESASWNGVIERLSAKSIDAIAIGNPLRSLSSDAQYVRDVLANIRRPIVLVGHSYGGMVVTGAADPNLGVVSLVYVCAFAPDTGESALDLASRFPGSTLGEALVSYPLSKLGEEVAIRRERFHRQFAADVTPAQAALMYATQRPVVAAALGEKLAKSPGWKSIPSWFVVGDADQNIPAELQRFEAKRANARGVREVPGGSHAVAVSKPDEVVLTILEAYEEGSRAKKKAPAEQAGASR